MSVYKQCAALLYYMKKLLVDRVSNNSLGFFVYVGSKVNVLAIQFFDGFMGGQSSYDMGINSQLAWSFLLTLDLYWLGFSIQTYSSVLSYFKSTFCVYVLTTYLLVLLSWSLFALLSIYHFVPNHSFAIVSHELLGLSQKYPHC